MNGFLVGNPGDVEKQKLFVECLGDFVVTKHLPLEHGRSGAADDSDGDHTSDEVVDCTTARGHSAGRYTREWVVQAHPPVARLRSRQASSPCLSLQRTMLRICALISTDCAGKRSVRPVRLVCWRDRAQVSEER